MIGVDGQVWDVSGPRAGLQGVEILRKTKRLLADTPAKTFWIKSGSGQRYQQFLYQRRDPLFGFMVASNVDPVDWRDIDSRFRASLGYYDDEFQIRATTQPDNQTRTLNVRLLQDPTSWASEWEDAEPHTHAAGSIMVDGACEIPHWGGSIETASWTVTSSGSASTMLQMPGNPGDVPIFPRWQVNAPASGSAIWTIPDYSWGQEGNFGRPAGADATRTVALPVLMPGEDSDVDTDDDNEYIVAANGAPVWMRTNGNFAYYPIAPKTPPQSIPVSVTGATPGMTITLELDRYYTRAWGVRL